MRNSSTSKRVIATAGLALSLAVATVPAAAQAPVVEPRPPVERTQPPLIAPPGTQQPRQQPRQMPQTLPEQPGEGQPGMAQPSAAQAGAEGRPETAPFRAPVLVADDEGGDARPVEAATGEGMGSLVLQLQQLQQEMMMLRGMVEAQQNTIQRLEREQRERYMDLDRRLARGGAGSSASAEALEQPLASLDPGVEAGASIDEQSAYESAFTHTRERRFDRAIEGFRELISEYPGGAYEANSWYWLGELYLALDRPDLEESRASFVQVLERWPEHHKVPDALYKLGVVYHQLGEPDTARDHLERVRREHSGSSAARLAATYLERL